MEEKKGNFNVPYTPLGMSVYTLLKKNCADKLSSPALSYFGKEISYGELMKNIDRTATALIGMGIKKGDVVIVSLPSVPEAVELFYAVNKVGAIFCGMDCRSSSDEIDEILAQVKPKACFVSDFHLHAFKAVCDVPIICISFMKTISLVSSFLSVFVELATGRTALIAKKVNFYTYKKFSSMGKTDKPLEEVEVSGEDVCAYFYTSGTTYGRKCAILTNENLNASITQYSYSQIGIEDTNRFCTIMPLFTCYGITLGTHLPLVLGKQVRMIPLFTGKNMKKLLMSEKPGYITTVPAHWEHFKKDNFKNVDLSFFKGAIIGGDKLSADAEEQINEILRSCNSPAKVMRGYGLTEASTAVTVQTADTPTGSVGTNMCWSRIAIFEPETDTPVPVGERGEICVCGPNVCKGYLDDEENTNRLLHTHSDGKVWMHSGDIGYMDENGFLYFCERIKRIFVRYDGTKMSPYAIEQQINRCPVVSSSLVYGADDPEHEYGKCPCALIVFKSDVEKTEAMKVLDEYLKTKISYHQRPVKVTVTDALPVTKGGKFDYFRAEALAKEIEEANK